MFEFALIIGAVVVLISWAINSSKEKRRIRELEKDIDQEYDEKLRIKLQEIDDEY